MDSSLILAIRLIHLSAKLAQKYIAAAARERAAHFDALEDEARAAEAEARLNHARGTLLHHLMWEVMLTHNVASTGTLGNADLGYRCSCGAMAPSDDPSRHIADAITLAVMEIAHEAPSVHQARSLS